MESSPSGENELKSHKTLHGEEEKGRGGMVKNKVRGGGGCGR